MVMVMKLRLLPSIIIRCCRRWMLLSLGKLGCVGRVVLGVITSHGGTITAAAASPDDRFNGGLSTLKRRRLIGDTHIEILSRIVLLDSSLVMVG